MTEQEKEDVDFRLWSEGRLKVEPWLWPRVDKDNVTIRPKTAVTECKATPNGELSVTLDNGELLPVDHIILATGYKVDMGRIPFLAKGNILDELQTKNGFPMLDEGFQSSVPGLYITSMPAMQDFGPFFGFTIAVRASARIIIEAIRH